MNKTEKINMIGDDKNSYTLLPYLVPFEFDTGVGKNIRGPIKPSTIWVRPKSKGAKFYKNPYEKSSKKQRWLTFLELVYQNLRAWNCIKLMGPKIHARYNQPWTSSQ